VKRHSRSVDLKRHCCGRCKGKLVEVEVPNGSKKSSGLMDRTPKKRAPPSGYNLFVKDNSKMVRERLVNAQKALGVRVPKVLQPDVMKECGRLWREKKQSNEAIEVE
jgi:hypothetical protein